MYIVGSKIKDYYDSVIGQYGIDKSCVYVRVTKEIKYALSKLINILEAR